MSDPHTQISHLLTTTKHLPPSPPWLTTFLSTQRPTTPPTVLLQTAHFRLLASDITTSLSRDPNLCLPPQICDTSIPMRKLENRIVVQVLDIEDVGRSRWEQVEAIEALERGEGMKGREIVRVEALGEGEAGEGRSGVGPFKLLMQDAGGTRVYGFEERGVEGLGGGVSIGCKILLSGVTVRRGMVMLGPGKVTVLGGKIEGLHKEWKEKRKRDLMEKIEDETGRRSGV